MRPLLGNLAFALAQVVAVLTGRASIPADAVVALVWPAAAVSVVWVAYGLRTRTAPWALAGAVAVALAINLLAGGAPGSILIFALSNLVHAMLGGWIIDRALRRRRRDPLGLELDSEGETDAPSAPPADGDGVRALRPRSVGDLGWILIAALSASLTASAPILLMMITGLDLAAALELAIVVAVRNTAGVVVFAPALLLLISGGADWGEHSWSRRRRIELISATAALLLVMALVFGVSDAVPFAFLVFPVCWWYALRATSWYASLEVIVIASWVTVATLAGNGVFSLESRFTSIVIAQIFIAVTALFVMLTAFNSEERERLNTGLRDARSTARDQLVLVRSVFDAVPAGITVVDRHGDVMMRNPAAVRMIGPRPIGSDEWRRSHRLADLDGRALPTPEHPAQRALDGEEVVHEQLLALGVDGAPDQVLDVVARRIQDTPHSHLDGGVVLAYTDRTEQHRVQQRLAESEQVLRLGFESSPVGMTLIEGAWAEQGATAATVRQANDAFARLGGVRQDEVRGMRLVELVHPDDADRLGPMIATLAAGRRRQTRDELRMRTGRWTELSLAVVRPDQGEPYLIGLTDDVTARREFEAELQHRALHDPLTALPNRILVHDRLQHSLHASRRKGDAVGLLFLDLDGFKQVNDTAGHATGDELLQEVALRLEDAVRKGDTVGRLSGDEFAVVAPSIGLDGLRIIAERILTSLHAPIRLHGEDFTIDASIGMRVSEPGSDAESMLHDADQAMYAAKRQGRGRIAVFTAGGPVED